MTNMVQYRGNQGSGNPANTGRGPSPFLWSSCPWEEIVSGKIDGIAFFDDFLTPAFTVPTTEANYGPYKAFTSTGGTILPATPAWGGVITLGSDGDDEGASIATVGLPYKINRDNGKLWFECRVKVSTIADTTFDAFIGLGDQQTLTAAVPITATAGSLADENLVGFHRLGTDGDYFDFRYKADGQTQVTHHSDAQVLVADTYVKLGMIWDPATYLLTAYGNGISLGTGYTVTTTAGNPFPNDVQLGLIAGVTNAAAATSVFTIDWWRIAQLAA